MAKTGDKDMTSVNSDVSDVRYGRLEIHREGSRALERIYSPFLVLMSFLRT